MSEIKPGVCRQQHQHLSGQFLANQRQGWAIWWSLTLLQRPRELALEKVQAGQRALSGPRIPVLIAGLAARRAN